MFSLLSLGLSMLLYRDYLRLAFGLVQAVKSQNDPKPERLSTATQTMYYTDDSSAQTDPFEFTCTFWMRELWLRSVELLFRHQYVLSLSSLCL